MIRKLETKDIDKIMDIWLSSSIDGHKFIDEKYWRDNYDTVKNVYIPMSEVFVYEDNNEIKGFIGILNNEFIGALFVDKNSQGLGIGSKLINYALNKYNKLNLAVYKDNENAVKFYNNKGFKIINEQQNEDSGFIEYIMEYKLS